MSEGLVPDDVEVSDTGEVEGVPVAAVTALAEGTVDAVAAGTSVRIDRGWSRARWWRLPLELWRRSIPLRVVSTTFVASIVILLLGGAVLMQAASQGVVGTKERNSEAAASTVLRSAQARLDTAALTPQTNLNTLLYELRNQIATQGNNGELYDVILLGPSANYLRSDGPELSSIPADLRAAVTAADGSSTYSRPTLVVYSDGRTVPGFVVGSTLRSSSLPEGAEVYMIFPFDQEVATLTTLQGAVITAGALLVVLLTLIAAVVARQTVSPIRAARLAAERLASGNLQDRMEIRGTDDFASLAASMNYMATELQKQINQLEDLSRVQQRFVSDVSHELRTPLTTVRMAAEVLYESRTEFDPVAARSAELLQNELDRFESLLTDLLEISRFDAGAAVLATANVDLVALTERVVAVHRSLADARDTEIRVHADGPALVEADARRVERIVRNLLTNAIEHSESNPIDIFVATNPTAAAIAVRDHGIGFEAEQAKQVFHRFWRADPARARTLGGTGLGLAISMEDARLHGGWIVAWGRPGMGAQFRLTLPTVVGTVWEESPLPLVPRDFVGADPEVLADATGGPVPAASITLVEAHHVEPDQVEADQVEPSQVEPTAVRP